MKKQDLHEEAVQVVRFEIEKTTAFEAYVEIPTEVLDEPDHEKAIAFYIDDHDLMEFSSESFSYRVDEPDFSTEAEYRAVQTGGKWKVEPLFHKDEPQKSRGELHRMIVRSYNGTTPLEYSFVPCIDLQGFRGNGVAYYCDGFVIVVTFWSRYWTVAVFSGFNRQYPINQASGAIPITIVNRVAKQRYNENTAMDVHDAFAAILKAGLPSTQSSRIETTDNLPELEIPAECDLRITPTTTLADDPDALLVRDNR